MAEHVATAQMFIDVRLTITDPDPAYPFRCGANPLAGVLPFIRFPLPVLSRLGGFSWGAWGTRLPQRILLVAQPEDCHGGAAAALGGGWRRRPPCPQHRVHQNPCKPAAPCPIGPSPGTGFLPEKDSAGVSSRSKSTPGCCMSLRTSSRWPACTFSRRRFGVFEPIIGCLDSIGMGKERGDAASRGRRHRFRNGHDAAGTAYVRPLGTAAMLLGPQLWLLVSDEAHDACLLLPAF